MKMEKESISGSFTKIYNDEEVWGTVRLSMWESMFCCSLTWGQIKEKKKGKSEAKMKKKKGKT